MDVETLYTILGDTIWKHFSAHDTLEVGNAIPKQLHSVIAFQSRLFASRIAKGNKGEKGEGKGRKDNTNGNY